MQSHGIAVLARRADEQIVEGASLQEIGSEVGNAIHATGSLPRNPVAEAIDEIEKIPQRHPSRISCFPIEKLRPSVRFDGNVPYSRVAMTENDGKAVLALADTHDLAAQIIRVLGWKIVDIYESVE